MLRCKLCFLMLDQIADVRLDPHKMRHMAPAVMDGCDRQVVDEWIAILLVVQQLDNARLACRVE